jgi:hypothetical protein
MTELICEEEEQEKASKALNDILLILKEAKLRTPDLILLYGNLGYSIGASIEGIEPGQGPILQELEKRYYEKPTVGVAMMLQGMLTTTWHDDLNKNEEKK